MLASRRFQPGEGPSRGLLRDCEPMEHYTALDKSPFSGGDDETNGQ